MNRKLEALIVAAVILSTSSLAYAFAVHQRFGATLTVTSPLQVFSDGTCTTPFGSTITLGSVFAGTLTPTVHIYIKNIGSATVRMQWNSTIGSVSNGHLLDSWFRTDIVSDINGTVVAPSGCQSTYYQVNATTQANPGSYSWTVTLGYS